MAADKKGTKWGREETILAYDLYCRTPFGKISKENPDIINLAELLGRSPSSVSFKMCNLAHFDQALQKRGVAGLSHTSKLDEEIYLEFSQDWEALSYQAQVIRADLQHKTLSEVVDLDDIKDVPDGVYRERLVKTRVGQSFFRSAVLNSYGNRCCITGISKPELLIASHIKPWKVSDERAERTNPSNGLCLNALHDKAFDQGLITIDKNYKIIISKRIKEAEMDPETRAWFMMYENQKISLPEKFLPGKDFIEYHNDVIFQG